MERRPYHISNHKEYESSFSQILQRTRQNINRISSRYGDLSASPNANDAPSLRSSHSFKENRRSNEPNVDEEFEKSFSGRSDARSNTTVEPSDLNRILERLNILESTQIRLNTGTSAEIDKRLSALEYSTESIRKQMEAMQHDSREHHRMLLQLQNQVSKSSSVLDVIQQDVDVRRNVVSKMESWAKQGEAWRDDVDSQIADIRKLVKSTESISRHHSESLMERASKADLAALQDKMNIFTQQAVAASMSAWHDKIEGSVRTVEKQVAALRLGRTVLPKSASVGLLGVASPDFGQDMSEDEIKAALATPFPSELLLKGMVATEVRDMENKLEEKLEQRVRASMRGEVFDAQKIVRLELREYLARVAAELGVLPDPEAPLGTVESESPAMKAVQARKQSDRLIEDLVGKVDDFTGTLALLQERAEASERERKFDIRGLEKRVEEGIAIAANSVTAVQSRCKTMEEVVRDAELAMHKMNAQLKDELGDKLSEFKDSWTSDRVALDKRLVVVERIAEDMNERVKISNSAIEAFFTTSKQVKRFEECVVHMDHARDDITELKLQSSQQAAKIARIDESAALSEHLVVVKEKVTRLETAADQVAQLTVASRVTAEDTTRLKAALDKLENSERDLDASHRSLKTKINSSDVAFSKLNASYTENNRVVEQLSKRLQSFEDMSKKDIGALKQSTSVHESHLPDLDSRLKLLESNISNANVAQGLYPPSAADAAALAKMQAQLAAVERALSDLRAQAEVGERRSREQSAVREASSTYPARSSDHSTAADSSNSSEPMSPAHVASQPLVSVSSATPASSSAAIPEDVIAKGWSVRISSAKKERISAPLPHRHSVTVSSRTLSPRDSHVPTINKELCAAQHKEEAVAAVKSDTRSIKLDDDENADDYLDDGQQFDEDGNGGGDRDGARGGRGDKRIRLDDFAASPNTFGATNGLQSSSIDDVRSPASETGFDYTVFKLQETFDSTDDLQAAFSGDVNDNRGRGSPSNPQSVYSQETEHRHGYTRSSPSVPAQFEGRMGSQSALRGFDDSDDEWLSESRRQGHTAEQRDPDEEVLAYVRGLEDDDGWGQSTQSAKPAKPQKPPKMAAVTLSVHEASRMLGATNSEYNDKVVVSSDDSSIPEESYTRKSDADRSGASAAVRQHIQALSSAMIGGKMNKRSPPQRPRPMATTDDFSVSVNQSIDAGTVATAVGHSSVEEEEEGAHSISAGAPAAKASNNFKERLRMRQEALKNQKAGAGDK